MNKKILVVFNPMAGSKSDVDVKKLILDILKKEKIEYDFFETIKAGKQPLEKFANGDYEKIIVSGGDGTVAEVVAFLIENKLKAALVIIPQGSANILARSLKISLDPKKALIGGLKTASKPMDAMKINNKYYGMIAVGMGYDSLVMKQTSRRMKRRWGIFAYIWTILKTIFFYRARSYKLNIDGKEEIINCKTVMTLNILPFGETKLAHYFIGTKVLVNDGMLNIVALNPKPLLDPLFSRQMKVFSGKKISIEQKKSSTFHIDGDVFKNKIVTIEILPKVIYIAH